MWPSNVLLRRQSHYSLCCGTSYELLCFSPIPSAPPLSPELHSIHLIITTFSFPLYIHKTKKVCHLAMPIRFIPNDATRRAFSAFHQGCIHIIIFDVFDRNINDCPTFSIELLAMADEIHFSGGHQWCKHLHLCKHLHWTVKEPFNSYCDFEWKKKVLFQLTNCTAPFQLATSPLQITSTVAAFEIMKGNISFH